MDSGIPQSLLTTMGEIVFNDLSGDTTASSLAGLGGKIWPGPGIHPDYPAGLPDGNGYQMQFLNGGGTVRNPVDNRPHKHGGIIHKFYAGPKYYTLDGLVIGDTPAIRQVLYDYLEGWIFAAMQEDARYFFKPVGAATRFRTCRAYDATEINGPQGSPGGSPSGIGAPKQYVSQFVAVNPFAYAYAERSHTILQGASAVIPNDGTVETWPVIEVYADTGGPTSWEISNGVYTVAWSGTMTAGSHIEVNMFNETMYLNGNSSNRLSGLDDDSDFWSIPSGGATVSLSAGNSHMIVKSNDAWV